MRVTQSATSRLYLRNLNSNLGNMNKLSDKITTGRKFNYGYEDPSGSAQSLRIRKAMFANDYYIGNMNSAEDILVSAESSLMTISNLGKEAYERVIQGLNGTMATEDKAVIAKNLENISDEILKTINASFADRYMFSGSGNENRPFHLTGDKLTFNGIDVNDATAMSEFPEAKKVFFDVGLGLRFLEGSGGTKEVTSTKLDPSSLVDTAYANSQTEVSFNIDYTNKSTVPPTVIQIPVTVSGVDSLDYDFTPPRAPNTDNEAVTNFRKNFDTKLSAATETAIDAAMAAAPPGTWPTNQNGMPLRPVITANISGTGAMMMNSAVRPNPDGKPIDGVTNVVDTSYLTASISGLTQTVSATLASGGTVSTEYAANGTVTTTTTGVQPAAGFGNLDKMLQVNELGKANLDATGKPTFLTLNSSKYVDYMGVDAAGVTIPNPSPKDLTLNLKLNSTQRTITATVEIFNYATTPPTLVGMPTTEADMMKNLLINLQYEIDQNYPPDPAKGTKAITAKMSDDGKLSLTATSGEIVIMDRSANEQKHIQSFDYTTLFGPNTTIPTLPTDMPYGYREPAVPLPTINLFVDGKEYTFELDPSYNYDLRNLDGTLSGNVVTTIAKPSDMPGYANMPQSKNTMMKQVAANLEQQIRFTLMNDRNSATPPPVPPVTLASVEGVGVSSTPSGALVFDVSKTSEVKTVGAKTSPELGLWINRSQGRVVDPQTALQVSLPGVELLGFGRNDRGHPNNLISLVATLASEFRKEPFDEAGTASLLNTLEERNNTVIIGLTEIGSRTSFIEFNRKRLEDENFNLSTAQSRVEYADPATTITEYKMAEMAYMATLQMGAKVIPSSLFDFMR